MRHLFLALLSVGLLSGATGTAQADERWVHKLMTRVWQSEFDSMVRPVTAQMGSIQKPFDAVCDAHPLTAYVDKNNRATYRHELPVRGDGNACVQMRRDYQMSGWRFVGRCAPHFVVHPCGASSTTLVQSGYRQPPETPPVIAAAARPNCDYTGDYFDVKTRRLYSWHDQRAAEELEIDVCEGLRRAEQSTADAEYNSRMAVWVPCDTDVRKIARTKFASDRQAGFQVLAACGSKPEKPREPDKCVGYWSGFETAGFNDPRWLYLRHMDEWQTCLYKEVRAGETKCLATTPDALRDVDRAIEFKCGKQPERPLITETSPHMH